MFEQFVAITELLINGLSSLPLRRNKRKVIAKTLGSLYRDLNLLAENGNKIFGQFNRHNSGKNINTDVLRSLLGEQHVLIPRIISILKRKDIKTIFSLRIPHIAPLQVLLFDKGWRIRIYLEQIKQTDQRMADFSDYSYIRPNAKIDIPNNISINRSKKLLKKIESHIEQLRKFIVGNFEIHEVI